MKHKLLDTFESARASLWIALIVSVCVAVSAQQTTAQQQIWNEWVANPNTHVHIPNVSYAGYKYGSQSLPTGGTLYNVKNYGAQGDGVTDDTAEIRNAIAAVGSSGGVVYFPTGTYIISGPLFVHKNNTILRGENRDSTTLKFTKSLNESYGTAAPSSDLNNSRWSWSGGLIWITPQVQNTYRSGTGNIPGSEWEEGWRTDTVRLADITASHLRGTQTINVSSTAGISAGQYLAVRITNAADQSVLKHLAGGGTWGNSYNWGASNVAPANLPFVQWVVQVHAVDAANKTVTLKQPLRFDTRTTWDPRLVDLKEYVENSGVEHLTLELQKDYIWNFSQHHNKEPGWNGMFFDATVNCFARSVRVVDADNGLLIFASKNLTATDVNVEYWNNASATMHHGIEVSKSSADCLIENFFIESKTWHGINIEAFSMGNVYSKGTMNHGTFDHHGGLASNNVFTEISIYNDGLFGGSAPRLGARVVNWNVNVTNNRNYGIGQRELYPRGAFVGVRGISLTSPGNSEARTESAGVVPNPANLYRAQRCQRTGIGC